MDTIEIIKHYMRSLQDMMSSGKLSDEEIDTLEFALELAEYEFFAELQKTQEELDHLKRTGMLN